MMRRRGVRRLLGVLSVLLLLIGIASSQAYADGLTDALCKEVPKPRPPHWGTSGRVMAPKDLSTVPDQTPDPFAPGSTLRISDVYGWSAHYDVYDLGCGNNFLTDPFAVMNTNMANSNLDFEQTNLALLSGAEDIVKSDQLTTWLGDTLQTIASGVTPLIFGGNGRPGWLGLAMIAAAMILAWNVRKMGYHDAMRVLGVVVVAIALTAFALVMPAMMNTKLDQGVTMVAQATSTTGIGANNSSPSDLINRESLYRTWLANNFGDASSKLAVEEGPKLWAATHYSYSDMKAIAANADARTKIDELKATQFKAVADKVKDTDPAAYLWFTGRQNRNTAAFMSGGLSGLMSVFYWISLILMAVARLMMPALVIAAPFLALLGVLQVTRGRTALASLWDLFTAAIVATAKFGIASAVMTLVLLAVYRSDTLNPGWKIFLLIATTVIAFMVTRPIRTLKTMIPGWDPNKRLFNLQALTGLLGTFVAAKTGVEVGLGEKAGSTESTEPSAEPTPTVPGPVSVPDDTPALPPPVPAHQQPSDASYSAHQVFPDQQAAPPRERAWNGVVAAPVAAELPLRTRGALPPGRVIGDDTDAAASATQMPSPIGPGGAGGGAAQLPAASENEIPTIEPTGIYIDEGNSTRYVQLEEPQLDADGVEHTELNESVTYQTPKLSSASATSGGAEIG